jgi:hypothetical protein
MCGRFLNELPAAEIARIFRDNHPARYNIAPTHRDQFLPPSIVNSHSRNIERSTPRPKRGMQERGSLFVELIKPHRKVRLAPRRIIEQGLHLGEKRSDTERLFEEPATRALQHLLHAGMPANEQNGDANI